jgi:hypothetical protein
VAESNPTPGHVGTPGGFREPPRGSFRRVKIIVTILYKPLGIVAGILAGLVGKRLFDFAWGKVDEEDPPKPNTEQAPWSKLLAAAALQGVIFKVTRTAVDRWTAKAFHYLFGIWPGEKRPEPEG